MIIRNSFIFIVGFLISMLLSPLVIHIIKRLKAKQTILHYVKEHETKNGTPTMGGLIFIIGTTLVSLCFMWESFTLSVISIAVMLAYGILGFLDDFLKIKFKQNLGLRAYQKVIGQVGIAIIIAVFVYRSGVTSGELYIPFTTMAIDIGWGIIPFVIFVYLAVVNSVNLVDGLDGLCSGVSFVYILSFACVIMIYATLLIGQALIEYQNIEQLCFAMCGALLAYFAFNCYPAKIFMGDTGSLALGGFIASIAVFSKLSLYIPILGLVYVITALSDILQVAHYKRTKKRIFLMAPLHHHFQKMGMNENKITAIYIISTMILCVISITLILYVGGF